MNRIVELKQKRFALVTEARDILNANKDGLSGENETRYQKIDADIDVLTKDIEREERLLSMEKEMALKEEKKEEIRANVPAGNRVESAEYRDAFMQYLKNPEKLSSEQRTLLESEKRALSVGTGSAGAYTVPQGFYSSLQEAMKYYGGLRNAGITTLRTASGNDMPVPTVNDTSNVGELLGESATAASQDVAFGQVTLKAYKYSSKVVLVPFELLQDSAFNLEAYLAKALGTRIARITNTHFTTGTGTGQPQGVVTGATSGKVGANGQTTSITYADVVDLIHSVDPLYRQGAEFMMNDSSLKAFKRLTDSTGRPLWLPSMDVKEPDTLLGYKYTINSDVATMAANAKSVLFGDFSNYYVREVMDIQLYKIVDKYIENGQVGFLCFYRADGRMVDAGTNPIKYYANSAT